MTQRKPAKRTAAVLPAQKPTALLADLRELILQAREGVARAVDSGLTALYWHIGQLNLRKEPPPHDPVRRSFSRPGDCRIADATIDVDPLHRADALG
jgi:UDP:flavonoid glycosyltransferase YjiC (YdhE family)